MSETDRIEKKAQKSKIRKAAQKDESSITFYLHASLFLFFLTTYAFLLFLYKNKYPLILNNEILPEVLFSCFGLLVFSFASLFLLSFWRFLARVFIAIVAGGTVAYILGLLLPFNIGNYAAHYVSFLPQNILMYAAENGNQIVAGVSALIFFILLNIFKGGAMAFLSLPVLVAVFMLLNTAAKQVIPERIQTAVVSADQKNEKTDNLIYLILADHTGYAAAAETWQILNSKNAAPADMPFSPAFISAFYKTNNFTFYPSAYLRFLNKYRNIGNALNPSLTEINDDLFNRTDAVYYVSSDDASVSATRNDLFKTLKNKGYRLNVYQSYPFDFCKDAGAKEISTCVTYPAPLGALYQTNLTTPSRLMLLTGHWLYSTPFGKKAAEYLYQKVNAKVDASSLPILGNPMSKSLSVGQSLILSRLRQDVLSSTGKNVFFAHLNLPHYPYAYDKNCQLRVDPMAWRSNAPYTDKKELNGELKRWEDYNQQLFCTYAQINYLINDLKTAKLLDKTTIVIHGDKGSGIRKEIADENEQTRVDKMISRFKNNMTTVFGIYKPKSKAKVNTAACDIGTLIDRHLLGNTDSVCQAPDFTAFTREEQDKSMSWIVSPVSENYLKQSDFKPMYESWLENGGQAFMASLEERLKQEKEKEDSSKISFVAPPAFMENQKKAENASSAKGKTTDFFPVPEEKPKTKPDESLPPPPSEKETDNIPLPPPLTPENGGDFVSLPADLPAEQPTLTGTGDVPPPPPIDIIADDLGNLPQPIVLPESSAQDKWKTTDIKDGQTTTLELVPPTVDQNAEQPVQPEIPEPPAPQAAPAVQVEVLPLPPPSVPQQDPATVATLPEVPASEQVPAAPQIQQQPAAPSAAPAVAPAEPEIKEQSPADKEAQAIAAAEAQIKAAQEIKAKAEAAAQARLKAEAEAKAKAEEEARLKAEEEAKLLAEADAQLKAAEEAKAKAEAAAQARIKAEAEAKAKAEEEARLKAEEEAKAKAEMEAQIKAAQEAQARARAEARAAKAREEEEERRRQEEAEREEMRKKTPPPPPANADELDIVKETLVERINDDGEVETFIYLERKPNPNKYKKKMQKERELQQQDLDRASTEQNTPSTTENQSAPATENTARTEPPAPSEQPASSEPAAPSEPAPATPSEPAATAPSEPVTPARPVEQQKPVSEASSPEPVRSAVVERVLED